MAAMDKTLRISAFIVFLGCFGCASANEDFIHGEESTNSESDIAKRLYDFGLGKRAYYRYTNEYKRLPMYDFGLGKRAKMYSFGLGKRSDDADNYDNFEESDTIPEIEMYDDESMQTADKRAPQMYSFGLGKRPLYEFGLGKRAPKYGFGLGKREKMYSFGLGKRGKNMYSFGLGKREISPYEMKDVVEDLDNFDAENSTTVLDSHEEMGHGQLKSVSKRSPKQFSFGLGKRDPGVMQSGFAREYRKPSAYSFGLGKRQKNLYSFGLGKRSMMPA